MKDCTVFFTNSRIVKALVMSNRTCMKTCFCIFIGINVIAVIVTVLIVQNTGIRGSSELSFASHSLNESTKRNVQRNTEKYRNHVDAANSSLENKHIFKRKIEHRSYPNRKLKQGDNYQSEMEIQKYADVINKRLQVAEDKCAEYSKFPFWKHFGGKLIGAVYSIPNKLNYCETPKVGCTFWKSVLRFLTGDFPNKKPVKKPSDIDRTYVHFGKWRNVKRYSNLTQALENKAMKKGKNFMFVREPYSRLWSGYLDKFYLPDFWESGGPKFRHAYEIKCADNITFEEFLSYIVEHSEWLNIHWTPLFRLCSPCHVRYDVIGKIETFSNDSKFILKDFGHGLLKVTKQLRSRAKEEIRTLTKYNFNFRNDSCFSRELIAKRLWSVFQMNGYIHKSLSFPLEMLKTERFRSRKGNATLEFIRNALKALDNQEKLGLDPKIQRHQYMLDGYKTVALPLLYKVKQLYKYDFELFGYDAEPREIFSR